MNRKNIIRQELEKAEYQELITTQDYSAIAKLLNNRPDIPNPKPQREVKKQFSFNDMIEVILPVDYEYLISLPDWLIFELQNQTSGYLKIFRKGLSTDSKIALDALLQQKELDPNYNEFIKGESLAFTLGLERVRAWEVQELLQ